jgi:putative transposase
MHWSIREHRRRAFNEPGHAHELTFNCFRRYQFLKAERTCQWLADEIDSARQEHDFALWAYVFMPEHVHLVIYPRQPVYDIRQILKSIKEPVGRKAVSYIKQHAPGWLPRITVQHGTRTAHRFWQAGGGHDRNLWESELIQVVIEYVHQNPVRRGLVEYAHQWRWSSAGWLENAGKNSLRPDPIDFAMLPDPRRRT